MPCTLYSGLNHQQDLLRTEVICLSNVKSATMVLECYSQFQALHLKKIVL
jgi:hypothetical protein